VIYLCKYCFPKGGWKIKSKINGKNEWGDTIAVSRDSISPELKEISLTLSKYIGNGLYGLDVKETKDGYKVIEINDNPSIYDGFEDVIDKDIYEKIIDELVS
jgi:glutathione synthase/RimK-type ligase-like ATP-grasp enzyme